jgi:hypothetical protein
LNVPTRPAAETWVQPADEDSIMRAMAILGEVAQVVHPAMGTYERGDEKDILKAILTIIQRHPMREDEVVCTLKNWETGDWSRLFKQITASEQVQIIERHGVRFYCSTDSYFPDHVNCRSRTTMESKD